MTVPSVLPDWMPWWVQLVLLAGVVLLVGAYGAMPFSVFGVKARLELLDERLDELQRDLRALTNRLPDPAAWRRGAADEEEFTTLPVARRGGAPAPPPAVPPPRPWRTEPQLNWPENRPRS